MNIRELKDQADDVRREIEREREQVRERDGWLGGYLRVLNVTVEQLSQIADLNDELERRQAEIDDLNEELERKQAEIDELTEQLEQREAEIADLQQQLLEAENQQLESEKLQLESRNQSLEAEVNAKPTEIHNHFGKGSSAQVFNDKVTGKFLKIKKPWKKREKRQEKRRRAL